MQSLKQQLLELILIKMTLLIKFYPLLKLLLQIHRATLEVNLWVQHTISNVFVLFFLDSVASGFLGLSQYIGKKNTMDIILPILL